MYKRNNISDIGDPNGRPQRIGSGSVFFGSNFICAERSNMKEFTHHTIFSGHLCDRRLNNNRFRKILSKAPVKSVVTISATFLPSQALYVSLIRAVIRSVAERRLIALSALISSQDLEV